MPNDQSSHRPSAERRWEEHNLSQLKYFRSLSLQQKLEAVEGMADVVRRFQQMRAQGEFKTASEKTETFGASSAHESDSQYHSDHHLIALHGCRPEPLAYYLKALGVLRLVSEQKDPTVKGWWKEDIFLLRTRMNLEELKDFFLREYQATPIVAPWNGGSGFYPKDKKNGINAIRSSKTDRLANYRMTIEAGEQLIKSLCLAEKSSGTDKQLLLRSCRNYFPDEAVAWLDAAYILTEKEAKYPPLLGTGGNDGRLEFTNNFMQRLIDLMEPETGAPKPYSNAWLAEALFNEAIPGLLSDKPIGQFHPGAAGGTNATTGFSSKPLINPWDFVLMIEGALVFTAAATKRLGNSGRGELSYPFATQASGVGYASASGADENPHGEIWTPLWSTPSKLSEVVALFSEGRAQVGRRPAMNGVDFARALATLGTDRGVREFQRYGFQVRNGLAYFATPLGRWKVAPRPEANLLNEIDHWLDRFRRAAKGATAPARIGRALRAIEEAIMDACKTGGAPRMTNILIALGEAEAALAVSPKFRKEGFLKPVPLLSSEWIDASDDGTVESQLALALASVGIRENIEPVAVKSDWAEWLDTETHPRVVWGGGSLIDNLIAILTRRCIDAQKEGREGLPLNGRHASALNDIATFISGDVDETRLEKLLWGCSLIHWQKVKTRQNVTGQGGQVPPALYALLKLTYLAGPLRGVRIPLTAAILARAAAGDAAEASRLAAGRLKGSGFVPLVDVIKEPQESTRRIAAALLFPISDADAHRLAGRILKESEQTKNRETKPV